MSYANQSALLFTPFFDCFQSRRISSFLRVNRISVIMLGRCIRICRRRTSIALFGLSLIPNNFKNREIPDSFLVLGLDYVSNRIIIFLVPLISSLLIVLFQTLLGMDARY